jgi:hypothetical protein
MYLVLEYGVHAAHSGTARTNEDQGYNTCRLVLEYGVHAAHSGTNEDQGTTHAGLRELILVNFGMYCSLDEMR